LGFYKSLGFEIHDIGKNYYEETQYRCLRRGE